MAMGVFVCGFNEGSMEVANECMIAHHAFSCLRIKATIPLSDIVH
jgi:hypothetical protein